MCRNSKPRYGFDFISLLSRYAFNRKANLKLRNFNFNFTQQQQQNSILIFIVAASHYCLLSGAGRQPCWEFHKFLSEWNNFSNLTKSQSTLGLTDNELKLSITVWGNIRQIKWEERENERNFVVVVIRWGEKCCAAKIKNENLPLIFVCARISSCRYKVFLLFLLFLNQRLFSSFLFVAPSTLHATRMKRIFFSFLLLAATAVDSSFQWRIWLFYSNLLQPRYVSFCESILDLVPVFIEIAIVVTNVRRVLNITLLLTGGVDPPHMLKCLCFCVLLILNNHMCCVLFFQLSSHSRMLEAIRELIFLLVEVWEILTQTLTALYHIVSVPFWSRKCTTSFQD